MAFLAFALLSSLKEIVLPVFNRFVLALTVFFAGFVFGKLSGKFVEKLLHEVELDSLFQNVLGLRVRIEHIAGVFVSYFIYFITMIMALDQLGIKTQILNLLSLAFLSVIVISIFLGIKDVVPNIIAGIMLHYKQLIKIGDSISFRNTRGEVVHTTLTETRIQTPKGDVIFIPNRLLVNEEFVKLSPGKSGGRGAKKKKGGAG